MRIGICDDQQEVRELLSEKIKKLYPDETVLCYKTGTELLLESVLPDILFLDIRMPETDGMQTAIRLRESDKKLILIFVTVLEEYVFQAFDVGAFHFLVKPFSDEKFAEVLKNAVRQFARDQCLQNKANCNGTKNIMITQCGSHIAIRPKDIVYAEVYNRKVMIHTLNDDIEYYGKMKELEKDVGGSFFRSHRSYLVNFEYIRKYDAGTIYLEKGQALMSKQNYHEFVKSYLRYNRRAKSAEHSK